MLGQSLVSSKKIFLSLTFFISFLILMGSVFVSAVSATVYEDALEKSADFLMTSIDSSGTWTGGWHKKSYEDDSTSYDTEWENKDVTGFTYTIGFSDDSVLATSNAIIHLLKAYDVTTDVSKKANYLSAAQTAGDLLIDVFIRGDGHFEMTPVEAYMPIEVCCEWKTKIVKNFGTAWVMLYEKTGDSKYKDAAIAFGDYFLTEAGRDTNPSSPYYGAIYTGQDRREDGVYQNGHHYIGSYSTGVIKSWVDIYGITGDSTYLDAAMLAAQAFIKYQFGSSYATKTTVQGWYTAASATPPDDADWAQMEGGFMFNRVDHGISRPETNPVNFATVSYTYYTSHLVKDLAVLHDELVNAGRTSDATEIENSLIAFGDWILNSNVQDGSGYFNNYYSVSGDTWSVSNAEVRTTAPTARALLAVYGVTGDTDYLIAANKAVNWLLADGNGYDSITGKESRHSSSSKSYISYSQVPFGLTMTEAIESIPTTVYVDDDDVTCGGNSPCFDNIQDGIDAVANGGTVNVYAGTYDPFTIHGRNDLTIKGTNGVVVEGVQSVATAYTDRDSVVFVKGSTNITLDGLDIEGNGLGTINAKSYGIIYEDSSGTIRDCTVSPNTIGDMSSTAIGIWDGSNVIIDPTTINNFGRIGVFIYNGCNVEIYDSTIECQVYSGEDEVCYGIEVEGAWMDDDPSTASHVIIKRNEIFNCDNTFPTGPSWDSGGIYINGWLEYFAAADSTVMIEDNDIHDNYEGIIVIKSPSSYAHNNKIYNNRVYGVLSDEAYDSTTAVFDAENNWWGSADGPSLSPGSGDKVSGNVDYDPWCADDECTRSSDDKVDLGDAPDSTNSFSTPMTAYSAIQANYPTVHVAGSPPYGPCHYNFFAVLGTQWTWEIEADLTPDQDVVKNINPVTDKKDRDSVSTPFGMDDGLKHVPIDTTHSTLPILHCQLTSIPVEVTIGGVAMGPWTAYLNIWIDYNRDGDWGIPSASDKVTCVSTDDTSEWVVQNFAIPVPPTGLGTIIVTTPNFMGYNPSPGQTMWTRVQLTPALVSNEDGSGFLTCYEDGETEDYLVEIWECIDNEDCALCEKCESGLCVYQSDSEDLKAECPDVTCKTGFCDGSGSCGNKPVATECDSNYKCSGEPGGDDMYGASNYKIPSQGYCDGVGNCDYSNSAPVCTLGKNELGEGTGLDICQDGISWCRDTCADVIDNDADGCTDGVDADCGGTETICNDGVDNDCDGLTDCQDHADCDGQLGPHGVECCSSSSDCTQDDCVIETCVTNECVYTNRPAGATDECGTCEECNIPGGDCTGITADDGKSCVDDCTYCNAGSCDNRPQGATDECDTCEECDVAGGDCTGISAETGKNCNADCYDCIAGTCSPTTEDNDGTCNDDCDSCIAGVCTPRQVCDNTECTGQQACNALGGDCAEPDDDSTVCTNTQSGCFGGPPWNAIFDPTMIFEAGNNDCCGDDTNEYNRQGRDSSQACCNTPNECVIAGQCMNYAHTEGTLEITCDDGVDNDCDDITDCADPDCAGRAGPGDDWCCNTASDCAGDDDYDELCNIPTCSANLCTYPLVPDNTQDAAGSQLCDGFCMACQSGNCGFATAGTDSGNDCPAAVCDLNNCDGSGQCQDATADDGYLCTDDCTHCNAGSCEDRTQCDATECAAGWYCGSTGGDCTDPNENSQSGEDVCEICALAQHNFGETWSFEALTTPYCCDNDANEYYVTDGIGAPACCDDASENCVDATGVCRDEYPTEITCNDGIDNDCDGLIDEADIDCDVTNPVSVINSPAEHSWHNQDFTVDISDSDEGSGLDYCQYRVYSNLSLSWTLTRGWTIRTCNSPITITVGPGKDCRAEGFDKCKIQVRAYDNAGNHGSPSRLFSIDWTTPTISSLKPRDNSYTNDVRAEISAHYYDAVAGIDLSSVEIAVDSVDKTGEATITFSKVSYTPSVDLNDGMHTVTVKVNDNSGNSAQKDWSFTVDTVMPIVDLISPESKTYDTRRVSTEVSVTNEEVSHIKRSINGGSFSTLCRNCDYVKKSVSYSDGSINLTIEAEDFAGNKAYETVNFLVDTRDPKIIKTLPEDDEIIKGTTFYIKYTEDNLVTISLYWKQSTAVTYQEIINNTCESGRNKECYFDIGLAGYNGQQINYYFVVRDPINNVSSSVRTITIDNTEPRVTIVSPEDGELYSERRIQFAVEVDETVESLEYSLDGGRFRRLCRNCNDYDRRKSFLDCNHTLVVKATDYAGNIGNATISFSVDSKSPRITSQYPKNKKYTNGTFTVVYTEDKLKDISLFYKGLLETNWKNVTTSACESGRRKECSLYADLTDYNGFNINYYFVVKDYVSETESKEYTEFVDTQAPILVVDSPIDSTTYYSRRVEFDITVDEEVTLEYSDTGKDYRRLCRNCNSYDRTRSFSYGTHELLIRATDKAGNVATEPVVFTVER